MPASDALTAFERGLAAQQAGRGHEAIGWYQTSVRRNGRLAPAHFNLAQLLRERGDTPEAAVHFGRAAALRPEAADAWLNLGAMEERLGQFGDAIRSYGRAIVASPSSPVAYFNLGNARLAAGDWSGAADGYRQAVALDPDAADAQWNLAMALLAQWQLDEGWLQYEWRWRKQRLDPRARADAPIWDGAPLSGKHLVVWREQGLGDEILFATCLPDLIREGASVTLVVTARLATLFQRAFADVTVFPDDGSTRLVLPAGAPPIDFHIPLGSLPRLLRRSRDSFPVQSDFLVPDPKQAEKWRTRLEALPAGRRIGICWRSGLLTEDRRRYYSSLTDWGRLFALPGCQWINLQYDECESELVEAERRFGIRIHRWAGEDLRNDLETVVALMAQLDAVVTAPTLVSAFAGALGLPTWQPNLGSDWTSFSETNSPWFPTLRVIAKHPPDTWPDTLTRVAAELHTVMTARSLVPTANQIQAMTET